MLLGVHHAQITILKGAEAQAREFYCVFLGLKEIPKPDSLQGRGGCWLELDGFQIHVGTEEDFD
ncbi:MAG: glyoxalase, partial [Acidobacteria bacterium]|nr:glyoxalase [Acidobacteriota bacterium]MCA1638430.1 glyoxalase [Acidobacteriota bacterium]